MSVPWQQGTPWQAQPWMQQQPPLNQPPAWAGATAAVSPTLWQQATATQPQGGTQAPPTWAGGQAGPTWAAAQPGAGNWERSSAAPTMEYANAASNQSLNLTGGPPPTGPGGLTDGNPNKNGVTSTAPTTPNLTLASDNAVNGPVNRDYQHWEDLINQNGNLGGQTWDGHSWQGGGPVAAGTYILGGKVRTWVNYDASRDTFRNTLNGQPESAWHLVNRWTADNVRSRGMSEQQAYNAALIELKRQAVEAKRDLNTLGFDLSNVPDTQQAPGTAQTPTTPTTPTTSLPGTQTQDPAPVTQQPTTTPTTGTSHSFGQLQTNDLASLLQAAANDPDRAAQILRLAQGQTGRPLGRMADFRDSLYGRSFQTALSLAGTDGQKDLQGIANDFLNQGVLGNDLIGYTGNQARQALGQDFSGVDSATMEKILRAALAEQGINMGSLGGSVQQGRLDDIVYDDWARNLGDKSNDTRNFSDLLNGSRFQQSMANYGRR